MYITFYMNKKTWYIHASKAGDLWSSHLLLELSAAALPHDLQRLAQDHDVDVLARTSAGGSHLDPLRFSHRRTEDKMVG